MLTNKEAITLLKTLKIYHNGTYAKAIDMAIEALNQTAWIPVGERLPKECEYIDNVCKYYLIQDEYGDMHVAHLCGIGWKPIESTKTLGCDVVAWMPLPERYKGGEDE